jgi:hypothetical protein
MEKRVNIRPGVSVLSVLRHLNYAYWNALAEFVDNALQSWIVERDRIVAADPAASVLRVEIELRPQDGGIMTIPVDFDFGGGLRASGFAAIRERASTTRAGFALFRRGRVIQGSGDEGYRPNKIFGTSNSYAYQRVFGELDLEGFEVSHTKDGFKWDENEDVFLDLLKEELSKEEMPLLQQARGYRVGERTEDLQSGAQAASTNVADALEKNAGPVVADLRGDQSPAPVPTELTPSTPLTHREIALAFPPWTWIVTVEHTADAAAEWLEISDGPSRPDANRVRRLGLRVSLGHPFMKRFAGDGPPASDAGPTCGLLRLG